MRIATVSATILAAALLTGATVGPTAGQPPAAHVPAHPVACDVKLNVIDEDPRGVNVRTTPEVRPDNIRMVLRHADWTRVHVVAQAGDWYQIDSYERMNDGADDEAQQLPGGHRDWINAKELGGVDAKIGGALYAQPNARGKPLTVFSMDESKLPKITVIGCQGTWYHVMVGHAHGWTRSVCSNERTTCV